MGLVWFAIVHHELVVDVDEAHAMQIQPWTSVAVVVVGVAARFVMLLMVLRQIPIQLKLHQMVDGDLIFAGASVKLSRVLDLSLESLRDVVVERLVVIVLV